MGETTDHRSDIWSLGVVLFEMLTGHTAFSGRECTEGISRHPQQPRSGDARRHSRGSSCGLESVARAARGRYQSANALMKSGGGLDHSEKAPTIAIPAARPSRRAWFAGGGGLFFAR